MPIQLSKTDIQTLWQTQFSALSECKGLSAPNLIDEAKVHELPANSLLAARNSQCQHYLLIAKGILRVQLVTDTGREVTLYRVHPGDGCILTTSCMISQQRFPAEGITETEVVAFTLNERVFNRYLNESAPFRQFIFQNLGQRLTDVLTRIDQIYSPAVDQTLAGILLKLNQHNAPIVKTHQDLAVEMGMARETISRHLKRFEKNGWIRLGRNTIEINVIDALLKLSSI
ncbi:MAG: Crp/Fnr family transcriptional regulator [Methylococcaceae bacterium]